MGGDGWTHRTPRVAPSAARGRCDAFIGQATTHQSPRSFTPRPKEAPHV